MDKKRKKQIRRAVVIFVLGINALFIGRKVNQLTADPMGNKLCPAVYDDTLGHLNQPRLLKAVTQAIKLPWSQEGGVINDASCLNETAVHGIVRITNEAELEAALTYAKENDLKVSMAGVRHSMGGHAFFRDAVVLDMTGFNEITLNEEKMTVVVQSGATWHDIQNKIHPLYAVKAMQSTDIFTVGGSISVNAHGMDHQSGSVGNTIRSMRIMLADGTIETVSPTENADLFNLVVGGYGLFGIILDVELDITENVVYESGREILSYQEFPDLFANSLSTNEDLGLMYVHLSTAKQSLLDEMIVYTYEKVDDPDVEIAPLGEVTSTKLRRFFINFSKMGTFPMRLKWFAEKYLEPRVESCTVISRNQAMAEGEACMVSRNDPMHDSVKYLQNDLQNDTDILQEYYIPRDQFISYVDGLREIIVEHDVNLLNASVRVIHEEDNFLNYAPTDMFSIVLYINQTTDDAGHVKMRQVTEAIIDLTAVHEGTFFLPYQLYYSADQLETSYPQIGDFFAEKAAYDPDLRFTNSWYEKYAPQLGPVQE